ncbi:MAG: asparagine synthase (glutamine-hydrolyzing) [Alphaproteobacteria bacterium]
MCGIAAIFAYGRGAEAVGERELLAVRDAMTARGPDGAGAWVSPDGRVGLGHRRLAIIDLSPAGAQPMASDDGQFRIVFNGEIYNFRELRADLERDGVRFRSRSDTEVLLHLYRRHGPDMVRHLRGMFAFALWDDARQGLLLARDPFGIKPLYYADDGATLRVASQVKALLAGGAVDTTPEPAGHAGFFLWGSVPEPWTLYRGIRALPAGTSAWIVRDGSLRLLRFFDLTHEMTAVPPAVVGVDAPAGRLREVLREVLVDSVRGHLVADVPVGVFLSSGLDSATLAALATETAGQRVETLTLGFREFEGDARDETPLAQRLADHCGTHHVTRWITAADFAASRESILDGMDQPSIDGVNTWFVAREAAACGLKVALSGLGGDELFGGYDTFTRVPALVAGVDRLGGWARFPWTGRTLRRLAAAPARWLGRPKAAGVLEYGGRPGDAYLLRRGLFMPWELDQVLDPDLAREGLAALSPLRHLAGTVAGIESDRLRLSALEMQWYMRNQLLRDADWAGMAHSLEIRVPLVDIALFRAVLPLLHGARPPTKADMAATPAGPLPAEVLTRPKTGFFVPVAQWMGQGDKSLRGWARHVYETFVREGNRRGAD